MREKVRLGDVCKIQSGGTPSRANIDFWNKGTIPWVKISDFNGKFLKTTQEHITQKGLENSSAKLFDKGTILYTIFATLGEACILGVQAATNQAIAGIKIIDNRLEKDYLYNFLVSKKTYVNEIGRGVAQNNINLKILKDFEIKLPPIEEQKRITNELGKITDLINKRKQQLEKLDELVKARFVEMFGDLMAPNCEWKSEKLVDTCGNPDDIKCGPFGTQLSKDEYQDKGIAVWEIPQINSRFTSMPTHFITEEKAKQLDAYSLKPGDIAMSRKGNVGKCAVFPSHFDDGIIHSDVLRIRVDNNRVLPMFMMHQLHNSGAVQHQIELVSSGAIMAGINVTKLKQILVYVPPMELQRRFVAFVEQVDKSKSEIQKSLEKLEVLKKALMEKYFG